MPETEFLIIGGGPTGLGAAARLGELGRDWHLLEQEDHFGGLASSWMDDQGFTWDLGGHVQFSHYDVFDRYMDLALGPDGWLVHERESWVLFRERFVPYPFQNNLHRLDPEDRWACVAGLLDVYESVRRDGNETLRKAPEMDRRPANFEEWMLRTFGEGVTRLFMRPYNTKVWAYPPTQLDYGWIGERVSVPDLRRVLRAVCTNEDDVSWGPNAVFRFPVRGGTGAVWNTIGRLLPQSRTRLRTEVASLCPRSHVLTTAAGEKWKYRYLVSTIPLNHLIRMCAAVVDPEEARKLVYSATTVVGVGIEGAVPDLLKSKCWMYFPEEQSPYYRVTVFSNYSPNNVAKPGEQWSLMAEISSSSARPVDPPSLPARTVDALRRDGLLPPGSRVVSLVHRHLPQGYPTPFLGRDRVVDPMLRSLERYDIFSRGRFGAWKYEVANQDHSFAQGRECVDRIIHRRGPEAEPTLFTPAYVNRSPSTQQAAATSEASFGAGDSYSAGPTPRYPLPHSVTQGNSRFGPGP